MHGKGKDVEQETEEEEEYKGWQKYLETETEGEKVVRF